MIVDMRIIITGVNSYISQNLKLWLIKHNYDVVLLSLRDDTWKDFVFYPNDILIHCAGLVHRNKNEFTFDDYLKINTELTVELAKKAKKGGVRQFVFMSTRAVYGIEGSCFKRVVINQNTIPNPKTFYGISKYQAENLLLQLEDDLFHVSIIRAPFIYGKNCKGNYQMLRKLVLKFGFIPKINNEYSMLYIDNLCELVLQIIRVNYSGFVLPQDMPTNSTSKMAQLIAIENNRKVYITPIFNPIIRLLSLFVKPVRTAFGTEIYDYSISKFCEKYSIVGFEESIHKTEMR